MMAFIQHYSALLHGSRVLGKECVEVRLEQVQTSKHLNLVEGGINSFTATMSLENNQQQCEI